MRVHLYIDFVISLCARARSAISRIRNKQASLTLNAAAQVFAQKKGLSVSRYLNAKDRECLRTISIEKIKIPPSRSRQKIKIQKIAEYESEDRLLKEHILEINKTYTHGCYTSCFVLCRKVLENLLIHKIIRKKYPTKSQHDRELYFDFNRNRFLEFSIILNNLRSKSNDFGPEQKLVERIADLSSGFKDDANDMTHSLYFVARKRDIDKSNIQGILDLIQILESTI